MMICEIKYAIDLINQHGVKNLEIKSSIGEFSDSSFGVFAEITLTNGQIVILEQWMNMSVVKEEAGVAIYTDGNCSNYTQLNEDKEEK